MTFPLRYCPGGRERLERLGRLFQQRAQDCVLAVMEVPTAAVRRFAEKHRAGYCAQPDLGERVAFWDEHLRERAAVEDDSVPTAYLSELDQGLYGGIVGGEVQFMAHPGNGWISSMVSPMLEDWSEFDALEIDRCGRWYRFYQEELEAFREGAAGKFGISHFILIDSLNFVFELFGATRTYVELIDEPERVAEAIDFAYELNVAVQRTFFERIPLLEGGTCSNMAGWLPGRIVSESVDPFHMTSVEWFERWGRGPAERILNAFDGGVLHIHGNGRHLLEAASSLRGLKALYVADDRGYPRAFCVLDELKRRTGDTPLVVEAQYPEFLDALNRQQLSGGVLYRVKDAPDAEAANRCMEQVRAYGL